MAVATTTTMIVPKLVPSSSKSTATSLHSLYQRAAHSFLHRDVPLTYSLVTSAFALLASTAAGLGSLHEQKRKWDILRITLEVTVYTSPPEDSASIPAPLRSNAMLSGPSLINMLHTRSLALFCPGNISKPDAAFLPAPILVTLAAASVKVNAPDVGRLIIEDWLARRGNGTHVLEDPEEDGYAKVIDVYCTSVLPALEEWDYATEFLQYEGQLDESIKASISRTLASLHSEHRSLSASMPHLPPSSSSDLPDTPSTSSSPTPTPSRPISPSSSSESISTSSTHTAVPPTPKGRPMNGLTPVSPAPQKPSQPHSAVTSRTVTPISGARRLAPPFRVPSSNGHAAPSSRSSAQITAPPRASSVNALTLMQSFLRTYFTRNLSLSRTVAVLLLLVLPVLSIIFRLRRRRVPPSTQTPSSTSGAVADVRRRLGAQKESGLLQILWQEVTRAIGDTVRMGGRGLV